MIVAQVVAVKPALLTSLCVPGLVALRILIVGHSPVVWVLCQDAGKIGFVAALVRVHLIRPFNRAKLRSFELSVEVPALRVSLSEQTILFESRKLIPQKAFSVRCESSPCRV